MKYHYHVSQTEAHNDCALLKSQGYRAYVLVLNKQQFEVRYWK